MDLKVSHCFVVVDDMDKALTFYRDVLGLAVHTDVTMENFRWLTLTPPGQPELEIVIESVEAFPAASDADIKAKADLLAKGLLTGLIFSTDNCDATFERLRAAGAEVLQEPIEQPYGVRDCAFRDPAGNMVRFSQQLAG
jgi:catechol 2,3-dioxygenase-like lactoylglutathione lyase family enzyme